MPIESVNDFVVPFANVNGSGSASATSCSPASTFVAADHTSIDRMNAELHPLLLGGHFAKAFLLLARRTRIPGRTNRNGHAAGRRSARDALKVLKKKMQREGVFREMNSAAITKNPLSREFGTRRKPSVARASSLAKSCSARVCCR
jgi:ribosomal protein S21